MGSSGNCLLYNKSSKNDIYFNGFMYETPQAPPFIINSHFHLVLLFIQKKELKTKRSCHGTGKKTKKNNNQKL